MSELHPFPVGTLQPSEELRTALSGMNPMPDARFVALVSGVLGALTRGDAGVDAAGAAAGAAEAAGARALHAVALDFAKCATAPAATRSALEVHGLSAGKGAAFADAYAAALPALRQALEETTGACACAELRHVPLPTSDRSHAIQVCGPRASLTSRGGSTTSWLRRARVASDAPATACASCSRMRAVAAHRLCGALWTLRAARRSSKASQRACARLFALQRRLHLRQRH